MSTKDRVFSRLFDGQKHNLNANLSKEHKVALSLVSDIENDYDWLEQSYSQASYAPEFLGEWVDRIMDFQTELSIAVDNFIINGSAMSFEEAATNMKLNIQELDIKADELGINPADLVANYSEIVGILENADAINADVRAAYTDVLEQANRRFGLADFS